MHKNNRVWIFGWTGFFIGAFVGFIYRPAAFLTGQLPFKHVISRGTTLKGLEQVHTQIAQTSFNYLLVGGIAGAILGIIIANAARKR